MNSPRCTGWYSTDRISPCTETVYLRLKLFTVIRSKFLGNVYQMYYLHIRITFHVHPNIAIDLYVIPFYIIKSTHLSTLYVILFRKYHLDLAEDIPLSELCLRCIHQVGLHLLIFIKVGISRTVSV